MVAITEEVEDKHKEEELRHVAIDGDIEGISLMINSSAELKRSSIFSIVIFCQKKPCVLVINGGSTRNLVSNTFVERLGIQANSTLNLTRMVQ